jgi:hypothetical protein
MHGPERASKGRDEIANSCFRRPDTRTGGDEMAKLLDGPTTLIFQSPPGIEGPSGGSSGGVIAVEVLLDHHVLGELSRVHAAHGHFFQWFLTYLWMV